MSAVLDYQTAQESLFHKDSKPAGFTLRPYQQRQHDKALAAWGYKPWWDGEAATARTIILKQPTAGGKTITASKIIETLVGLGIRCLFCADTNELVMQPLEKLHKSTGIIASLEKAECRASLNAEVVVASVQSMMSPQRLTRFPVDHFGVIFHDEAHEGCERAAKVNARFPNAKLCGLSATPFRINLANLSKWYEIVADELDLDELIDGGYIPPTRFITDPLEIDFSNLKMSVTKEGRDVNLDDSDRRIIPWFEAIVQRVMTHTPNAISLAFHGLVATSKKFVEVCRANGLDARHVDGASEDREDVQEWFRNSTGARLLSNAQLLKKGWDCDVADTLIPLRITKSIATIRQQAGRVLRPLTGILNGLETAEERIAAIAASSKPEAVIYDFLGLCEQFGLSGPAPILGNTEDECQKIAKILKKNPDIDFAEIRKKLQVEREEILRRELERKAEAAAKSGHRSNLKDARELVLQLGDAHLADYEPAMPWEKRPATPKQLELLAGMGFDGADLQAGLASKLLDATLGRQKNGKAPLEAFAALRFLGVEHPESMSLIDAIRKLGVNFPCTFGKKNHGVPLCRVPASFWRWLGMPGSSNALMACRDKHPATYRYYLKFHAPAKQQPELSPAFTL